jgi:hypothetical protein
MIIWDCTLGKLLFGRHHYRLSILDLRGFLCSDSPSPHELLSARRGRAQGISANKGEQHNAYRNANNGCRHHYGGHDRDRKRGWGNQRGDDLMLKKLAFGVSALALVSTAGMIGTASPALAAAKKLCVCHESPAGDFNWVRVNTDVDVSFFGCALAAKDCGNGGGGVQRCEFDDGFGTLTKSLKRHLENHSNSGNAGRDVDTDGSSC